MKKLLLVATFIILALRVRAEISEPAQVEPETWADEKTNTTLMLFRLPKASSTEEVRDQAAGFLEGPVHSGQFLPRAMGNITFAGLPGLYMRGALYGGKAEQEVVYLLLFAEEFSAIAVAAAPLAPEVKSVREHLGSAPKPLLVSKAIIEEIGPKIRDGVAELQSMAKKLIDQKKANQASEPTAASGRGSP